MNEGINRRMVLGATGATLVLASCKSGEADKQPGFDDASVCDDYGDSPRLADGAKPHKNIDWMPAHYCVVYINMDSFAGQPAACIENVAGKVSFFAVAGKRYKKFGSFFGKEDGRIVQ